MVPIYCVPPAPAPLLISTQSLHSYSRRLLVMASRLACASGAGSCVWSCQTSEKSRYRKQTVVNKLLIETPSNRIIVVAKHL